MTQLDWGAVSPEQLIEALETIPKLVAYAWRQSGDGTWHRDDVLECGVAYGALVTRREKDGKWRSGPGNEYWSDTAEEAKALYDARLREHGWILTDVPSPIARGEEWSTEQKRWVKR